MPTVAVRTVQTVLCGTGAVVTARLYGSFFAGGGYLPRLAVMAAAGTAVGIATSVRHLRRAPTAAAAAAVFALCSAYAVLGGTMSRGLPGGTTLRTAGRGLAAGWAAMLTVGIPAPASGRLLMTPAALTFTAAFAATVLALRTRAVLAPAAALLPAEIAGLLFTAGSPGRHLTQSTLLLTVLLLLALIRATPAVSAGRGEAARGATASPEAVSGGGTAGPEAARGGPARPEAVIGDRTLRPEAARGGPARPEAVSGGGTASPEATEGGTVRLEATEGGTVRPEATGRGNVRPAHAAARLAAAALVVAVAVPAATALPFARGHDRFDPRALMPRHLRPAPALDPLSEVRAELRRRPATTQFTIRLRGDGGTDRVRTAVLDTFDGARWTSSDQYPVAGPALAAGPWPADGPRVTEHVVVAGLSGPFLPVAGHPATVHGDFAPGARIGFDARSGTLVTDAPSLTGAAYTLTGVRQSRPPAAALGHAAVGTGPAFAAYTAQPAPPPALVALAARLTAGAAGPYAKLVAIDDYLRRLPYSLQSPPGESYGTLTGMLTAAGTSTGTPAGTAGGSEQHAAAFAVLARTLGIPTRIAVGYLLPGARHGTATVTTADAWAWPQVYFADLGWIDFDPTDTSRIVTPPPGATAPEPPPATVRPRPPTAPTAYPRPSPAVAARPTGAGTPPLSAVAYALAALLTAAAGANVTAKHLRRRRRRSRGGPSRRVAAAWREATDRLAEAGLRFHPSLTVEEIAEAAAGADPATPHGRTLRRVARTLTELAPLAGHAMFAAEPSGPSDVARAWRLEHRLRGELYPRRRTLQRALHRLKPIRSDRPRRSAPPPGAPA